MWNTFLPTKFKGIEQIVAVFPILPEKLYHEFALQIAAWTNNMQGPAFNVAAAYNIVPVAFAHECAQHYKIPLVSVDPAQDKTHLYSEAYGRALQDISQRNLSNNEKGKHFAALHSFFRESHNRYKDIDAIRIVEFMNRPDLDFYFASNKQAVHDYHGKARLEGEMSRRGPAINPAGPSKTFGKLH